jgi:hypothetical protein
MDQLVCLSRVSVLFVLPVDHQPPAKELNRDDKMESY